MRLVKKYGCRERAPAVCLPLPDYILIEAFKVLETKEESWATCKQANLNMATIGASAHAILWGLLPFFWLYEVLVRLGNQIRDEGISPWTSLDGGPSNVLEWIDYLSSVISDGVFKGLGESLQLSGKASKTRSWLLERCWLIIPAVSVFRPVW